MDNHHYTLLTELVRENMKQVSELRSSFDHKLDVLSDRLVSRVEDLEDSIHGRVDDIETKVNNHSEKFSAYDHFAKVMKNMAIAVSGGVTVLAGILAVIVTLLGLVHPAPTPGATPPAAEQQQNGQ